MTAYAFPLETAFFQPPAARTATVRPRRVVLFGCGVVGGGVLDGLARLPGVRLVGVVAARPRAQGADGPRRLIDAGDAFGLAPDLVIEALPDIPLAERVLERAIADGVAVVSANKAVLARRPDLVLEARRRGADLRYSAAVGGGVPVLETITDLRTRGRRIHSVRAVLNGTSNFVLDHLEAGDNPAAAIAAAQAAGFAEADPTADLDGLDAAAKLRLIARAADIAEREPALGTGIASLPPGALRDSAAAGRRLRQVARLGADGKAAVTLEDIPLADFLAGARGEENRVEIRLADGETIRLAGRGAGREPTASAVLADVRALLQAAERRR